MDMDTQIEFFLLYLLSPMLIFYLNSLFASFIPPLPQHFLGFYFASSLRMGNERINIPKLLSPGYPQGLVGITFCC
jgi:hypothetical protein